MKGVVLVNCGELGLDWERCSLSMYVEACMARDPDAQKPQAADDPGLRKFMKAHGAIE